MSNFKPVKVELLKKVSNNKVTDEQLSNFKQLSRITLQIKENKQLI